MRLAAVLLLAALTGGAETEAERRSQLTLQAMRGEPVANANREIVAVARDPLGKPGQLVRRDGDGEVWTKPLSRGEWAVALFNRGTAPISVDVIWKELGLKGSPRVSDLWAGKVLGKVQGGFAKRLEARDCAAYRVKP